MKVVTNDAKSLFDEFDELTHGGVVVYRHRRCRSNVTVDLRNICLGDRLRALIIHYDECIRKND